VAERIRSGDSHAVVDEQIDRVDGCRCSTKPVTSGLNAMRNLSPCGTVRTLRDPLISPA